MKEKVQEKIKELEDIIGANFGVHSVPNVEINYNLDSKTSLGTCKNLGYGNFRISLNEELLNTLKEEYIKEVKAMRGIK
jgi:hypothetical protein